jgi:uncharacterized cupredoxin-like copper-binding protein
MKKITLVGVLTLGIATNINIYAQANKFIEFDNTTHDFGTFKEELGNVEHSFKFKNVSDSPIKLIYVKASCGCTTPTWTKDVIPPGGTGEVVASYGAKNRPGSFNKTITVKAAKSDAGGFVADSNAADVKILTIKGDVTPRVKGVEDWYPQKDGSLRFSTNHINYGKITTKDKPSKDLVIYNEGPKPVTIENVETNGKSYIEFVFNQGKTVKPKDSIRVTVKYDAEKVGDYDFIHDRCTMVTNDDSSARKTIYVGSTIEPYVGDLTPEQKANAPKASFQKETHDFGTITEGETVKTEFTIKNEGKSDLQILKTKATCGCTATDPEKKVLKPGESTNINVSFNSTGKEGNQTKQITVVTNDPERPTVKLTIKANINKKDVPANTGSGK